VQGDRSLATRRSRVGQIARSLERLDVRSVKAVPEEA